MHHVILNNGLEMPILGLGVYQIEDESTCERVVSEALELGYRLIDTASAYGNEVAVGRAIRASGIPRDELFVTTKLWVDSVAEKPARSAFSQSLERLGLDYLDLYLIHQPYGDVFGAWRTLETLYRSGLTKAIGVSNFHPDRLMDLICHHSVVPAVNQVETHPFYQRRDDHAFMQDNRVQHQSWASFAEGRNNLFGHPVLTAVAARHGRSVAQVVLRWLIQRNIVVIPKSVNRERLAQNIDVFDFDLTPVEMKQISTLDENESLFFSHRDPERVKWLSGLRLD